MTVASQLKQCTASIKNIEASLNSLAIQANDDQTADAFHQSCLITRRVLSDLEKRVGKIELEEPQYKGY